MTFQIYKCEVCYKKHGFFCDTEICNENPSDDDFYCPSADETPIWVKSSIPQPKRFDYDY